MKSKWWQLLIPKYGNWGGPGWCGGEYCNDPALTLWEVMPIDAMDLCFKNHDWSYQNGVSRRLADGNLVWQLSDVNPRGWYANAYKLCAMAIFWIRSRICK